MAISDQTVTVAECDACGAKKYSQGSEPISGVVGTVTQTEVAASSLKTAQFFSCRADAGHVGKAAAAALSKVNGATSATVSGNGTRDQRPAW